MNIVIRSKFLLPALMAGAVFATAGVHAQTAGDTKAAGKQAAGGVNLTGAQEVPPVSSNALGTSTIKVADDKSVSGSVTTSGIVSTAAHIHEGAKGVNGPVVVPLNKASENTYTVPDGARLTDAQYASYKEGKLYVNVHSAAYPNGEIRTQLPTR